MAQNKDKPSNAMWGGRFTDQPDALMTAINASIRFDRRLWREDLAGSRAHAAMLVEQGLIASEDGAAIARGLDQIEAEIAAGRFPFSDALEDIHMNIEARLREIVGRAAGRLHTARSRNDQVATDFKLWVRAAIDRADALLRDFQAAIVEQAARHAATVMPGFTHLQSAQPVTLGHHLLAYYEMARRDRARFVDARGRLNECPLGAAALAGTSFAIDREATARALGFARPTRNSIDSVADRDFALDYLAAAGICAVHLSRLAEECVIWSSQPFGFIRLSDRFTTGSSIMPQKKNPDAAELVRAKAGRILGHFQALAVVMKGLPLAYQKDVQEDKEPVFDAADTLEIALSAMTGMLRDAVFDEARLRAAAGEGYSTATDLADWLVRTLDMPFRDAHRVTGAIVKRAEEQGVALEALPLAALQAIEPRITAEAHAVLALDCSVASRTSFGGTAPARVREQIAQAKKELGL